MSYKEFRDIKRKKTKEINVGDVKIGGDNPISVQSMTNTEVLTHCDPYPSLSLPHVPWPGNCHGQDITCASQPQEGSQFVGG